MVTKVYYEGLNLFLFDQEEETIEWCVFHIEGFEDEDGDMCDTYDVYTFSFDTLLDLAEDFDADNFLIKLMNRSTERIYTAEDDEFYDYEELFQHSELVAGTPEDLKDYIVNKIKENENHE